MEAKIPDREKFAQALARRQGMRQTLKDVVTELDRHYKGLDIVARDEYTRTTTRMFANYENRWLGNVNSNGKWVDDTPQGANNTYFTVPLLTAHVDTHTTFYTKTRPVYKAIPFVKGNHLARRLAEMCQEIASDELNRMLKPSLLQHEAQYLALATLSYRHITMDYMPHSPIVMNEIEMPMTKKMSGMECLDCGEKFEAEGEDDMQCPNENCMSDQVQPTGEEREEEGTQTVSIPERLPRPKIRIPNPVLIQRDFNAPNFYETRFLIERKRVPKKEAEFYHQIDLSDTFPEHSVEHSAVQSQQRMAVGATSEDIGSSFSFSEYARSQQEMVDEVLMWLKPCEYGLFFADGELLAEQYPNGLHIYTSGGNIVRKRPCDLNTEWVRVQHGVRPAADTGMGMVHVADLNDVVNNTISLEYSILRTHGFPIRLFRGKYIKGLPHALQNILVNTIPETTQLSDLVHTEAASNTSGLLGILTQKVQGFMQLVSGNFGMSGGATPGELRDVMGNATGASAIQEMMADRMGLSVQMRVEADIETMFSILTLLQQDKRNKKVFLESGYDETVVEEFFKADFRSKFYFEPAKGTDSPMLESVNAFKVQSFASLTANLTGLRQYDASTFYDIISALGETLNIDTSIGAGRKEKNLAENKITRIIELYREEAEVMNNELAMDPATVGGKLFQAVVFKERTWLESVIQTSVPQIDPNSVNENSSPEEIMQVQAAIQEAQLQAAKIEAYLYDYKALMESYSDWLQSDNGQNADLPIQVAVGLLYAYAQSQADIRQQIEQQQLLATMADAEEVTAPDNPPGALKSDGQMGPGRPREIRPGE